MSNKIYKGKYIKYKDNGENSDKKEYVGYVSNEDDYTIFITEGECVTDIVKAIRKKDIGRYVDVKLYTEKPVSEREKAKARLKDRWNNTSTLGKIGIGIGAAVCGLIGLSILTDR